MSVKRRLGSPALVAAVALAAAGCQNAHVLGHAATPAPTNVALSPVGPFAVEDRLYDHAVKALQQRDYGLALDILQMAREARPDDPRVLTAMGVVYDKLGRFDLSTRYYDLAEKADPGSRVVATDRAYSQLLQRTGASASDDVVVMAARQPDLASLRLAGPEPMDFKQAALVAKYVKAGVRVRNDTGVAAGADRVKARLAVAGWTLTPTPRVETRRVAMSRVAYPAGVLRVAKALARSLPYPVKLSPCSDCTQLQVLVGTDALPRPIATHNPEVRRG